MKIFELKKNVSKLVKESPFKLEKDIQKLIESNMNSFFDLELITSEFQIRDFRFDSLCFDEKSNAFVIVEYKKSKNFSVIDQGYSYLSTMLHNKAEMILEYNEKKDRTLKKDNVDWTQSRLLFVSPNYTNYQKKCINFKNVPFELWEIKRYHDYVVLDQHVATGSESISLIHPVNSTALKNKNILEQVNSEIKVYQESDFTESNKYSDEIKEAYEIIKKRIFQYNDVTIKINKFYVAFVKTTNFTDVQFQKNTLKIWVNLRKGDLDDPKNICRDVSKIGKYGNGDYEIKVDLKSDIDYLMFLIKQAYLAQD